MPTANSVDRLSVEDRQLRVDWAGGGRSRFAALWLRDNCPCSECRHPSGQRLVDTFALSPEVSLASAALDAEGRIVIAWSGDGHVSRFDPAWLRANDSTNGEPAPSTWRRTLWAHEMQARLPEADYEDLLDRPEALRGWLRAVAEYGFALLHGVPAEPGRVTKVAELFGYVRETNYGRLFDVRSVVNPNNLAYTGLALGAHTDNPYRNPTPSVQLLHCLSSSASGGENTLVDGFRVAEALRQAAPAKFDLLAHRPVQYHFQDAGADVDTETTVIGLDLRGEVAAVRLNNRSLAPLRMPPDVVEAFYDAYRTFAQMLESDEYRIQFKLGAGDLFIVDNLRVLHGRTGFSGAGNRHLQGCYADMDGLRSKLAVLERREKESS